jgi:hypothetical protein
MKQWNKESDSTWVVAIGLADPIWNITVASQLIILHIAA